MRAVLGANLTIYAPGPYRTRLLQLATFKRKGRVPKGQKRIVRLYHSDRKRVVLPRGLLAQAQEAAPLEVQDRRLRLPEVDFGWHGKLRPEQSDAVYPLAKAGGGVLLAFTGAGKTEMGMALIASWRQPALWIVHTKPLFEDARERARRLYNVPARAIGQIGSSEFMPGSHLTVAMVQTLARCTTREWELLRKHFGTIVIDECHHTPAMTVARVVSRFPAVHRLGLTATPNRPDGLAPLLFGVLGSNYSQVSFRRLLQAGRVVLPTVHMVRTGWRYDGEGDFNELQKARAGSSNRNALICRTATQEHRKGRRVLIVVTLRSHARLIALLLRKRYHVPAFPLVGGVQSGVRRKCEELAAAGKLVLVATRLINEGWNVPAMDCLIMGSAGRSPLEQAHQIGRIVRSHDGKTDAVVYDFVDDLVDTLRDQATDRLEGYRAIGLKVS